MNHVLRRFWKGQRGQALTEFVIVAPLLLLLLMATVGFGHAIYARMIVVQAANRAARLGAVLYGDSSVGSGDAYAQTQAVAIGILNAGLSGTQRTVSIMVSGPDIHVTVTYQERVFVPFLSQWLGSGFQLQHESIYRIERDTA